MVSDDSLARRGCCRSGNRVVDLGACIGCLLLSEHAVLEPGRAGGHGLHSRLPARQLRRCLLPDPTAQPPTWLSGLLHIRRHQGHPRESARRREPRLECHNLGAIVQKPGFHHRLVGVCVSSRHVLFRHAFRAWDRLLAESDSCGCYRLLLVVSAPKLRNT